MSAPWFPLDDECAPVLVKAEREPAPAESERPASPA